MAEYFRYTWNNELYGKAIVPVLHYLNNNDNINNNVDKLFENDTYINIYTICFSLCTQDDEHCERLYTKYQDTFEEYLSEILPLLLRCNGDILLRQFIHRYDNNNLMTKWLISLMLYLDRYYLKINNKMSLEDVSFVIFKNKFFENIKTQLTNTIIDMINIYRNNNIIDDIRAELINKIICIYESFDNNVYKDDFMKKFILETFNYYTSLSINILNNHTVTEYITIVDKILDFEKHKIIKLLNKFTEPYLMKILIEILIANNADALLNNQISGMLFMIDNDLNEDLTLLCKLFTKYEEGDVLIGNIFKIDIITKCNSVNKTDETLYINTIIQIYNKYNNILINCFNNNNKIKYAFKNAFTTVINDDNLPFKYHTILTNFCDKLLKSNDDKLTDSEIENILDNIILLLNYLIDKDLFAETYRQALSKRLLNQKSISNDLEKYFISKLKIQNGVQFTSKIEGMMNDMVHSVEQSNSFKEYLLITNKTSTINNIELDINVYTNGFWPSFKLCDVHLPILLKDSINLFNTYYTTHNASKKLSWIFTLGSITLTSIFKTNKYEMNLNTLQGIVLLLFNSHNILEFEKIEELTNIPSEILKRVLHSLACSKFKILNKYEPSPDQNNNIIKKTDKFIYNDKFTSKIRKFKIPMASIDDIKENNERIDEDRSLAIDGSIVRIMKSRKTLNHNSLMSEVMTQLLFFKPDPKLIKKRIESLIDREYLERNVNDNTIYNYLA